MWTDCIDWKAVLGLLALTLVAAVLFVAIMVSQLETQVDDDDDDLPRMGPPRLPR